MARQIVVEIVGDASKFNSATTDAVNNAQGMGGKLKNIFQGIGQGVGQKAFSVLDTAISSTIGFLGDTVTAASNLSESMSKMRVVFGDSAAGVESWSKTAAEAMGLSQQAAIEASGTFGNLLTAMGMTQPEAAGMSEDIVQLSSDLASFNNLDTADVLEKIRAGLTGESEPLKSLGVNINEALIKQKALTLGLWDGKGALSANAKAQAAYALILEQTTAAQGDFARTSDGLANQQRISEAKMADLSATIGSKLLPVIITLQTFLVDSVIPAFENIFNAVAPVIEQIIKALIPAFKVVGAVAGVVFKGIGVAIGVVAGVIRVQVAIISGILNALRVVFTVVGNFVKMIWDGVIGVIKGAINGVIGIINGVIGAINGIQVHIHVGPVNLDWNGLKIPKIPKLHAGGIVPGTPGAEVLTLLQAGERVLPRNRAGGAQEIHIHIDQGAYIDGPSIDLLTNKIAARLRVAPGS